MSRVRLAAAAPSALHSRVERSATRSLSAVEERLAAVERQLQVQFARIAQLQVTLDRMRRSFDRAL